MLAAAPADDASGPAVRPVSYTTGRNGSTLKWLPYQPGKTVRDSGVVAAAASEPAQGPANNAFSDPFGDKAKLAGSASPVKPLDSVRPDDLNARSFSNDNLLPFPSNAPPPARLSSQAGAAPQDQTVPTAPRQVTPSPAEQKGEQTLKSIEQEVAAAGVGKATKCLTPEDLVRQRPMSKITQNIRAEAGQFPEECGLGNAVFVPRCWAPTTYTWTASALCHKPLYFEEIQVERYGHTFGPILQPFISAGHFFVAVPMLPYNMGLEPWNECIYTLGYYRPGSCAPYMLDPFPLSVRAGLLEAGALTGLLFAFP